MVKGENPKKKKARNRTRDFILYPVQRLFYSFRKMSPKTPNTAYCCYERKKKKDEILKAKHSNW